MSLRYVSRVSTASVEIEVVPDGVLGCHCEARARCRWGGLSVVDSGVRWKSDGVQSSEVEGEVLLYTP